jgi:hypothetical protein
MAGIDDRVAALKAARAGAWRRALPENVNDLPPTEARLANVRAMYSPEVKALDEQIQAARREQWGDHPGMDLESMPESRRRAAAVIVPRDEWRNVAALVDADGDEGEA